MDSIKINTGEKRICINDDPARVIVFNPSDVLFAEKFYQLMGEFEQKLAEYQARSETIDENKQLDAHQLPINMEERISLLREACEYIRGRIDHLFGAGISQKAFGETLALDVFTQFFEGITPYIQSVREDRIAQYSGARQKRVMK